MFLSISLQIFSISIFKMIFPAARCPSPVTRRPLPVARPMSPVTRCPSLVARRASHVPRRPSPVGRCPSPSARCPSDVARCPLPVGCRPEPSSSLRLPVAERETYPRFSSLSDRLFVETFAIHRRSGGRHTSFTSSFTSNSWPISVTYFTIVFYSSLSLSINKYIFKKNTS